MSDGKNASNPRIFVSAGEPSGDLHASNLLRAISRLARGASFKALGGPAMEAAGADLIHNMLGRFAVMGVFDALKVVPAIRVLRNRTLDILDSWRPQAAVLVDYPGFNLNLALHLKRRGIPVFYYICPQVWAWAPWRIKKIARRIDRALVVFPFEEGLYSAAGIPVDYVGHPLGDVFAGRGLDTDFIARCPLAGHKEIIALLPGSRTREIERGFPIKLAAARIIRAARPHAAFAVPVTSDAHADIVARHARAAGLDVHVFVARTHEIMSMAAFAVATSGTATLELAHFGVPMVVLYRTSRIGIMLKNLLLTTPHIALVNIVAGKRVVPELVYAADESARIASLALDILSDPRRLAAVRRDVRNVGSTIDAPGASDTTARIVLGNIPA